MEDREKEKYKALHEDGTLDRGAADARRFCAPILCWRDTLSLPEVLRGGTITFVDTRSVRFAVTCDHVIAGLLDQRRKYQNVTYQIGNQPFVPEEVAFRRNASADLATFEFSNGLVEYFPSPRWPPGPLTIGEGVYLGGYPKIRRAVRDNDTLQADFVTFNGRVEEASSNHATLKLDSSSWYIPGPEMLPAFSDYGGMSGGPAFRGDTSLADGVELSAIVFNSHIADERIYVRQLSRITAEGYIV